MFAPGNSNPGASVSSQADHSHPKQHQQPELTVLEQEVIDEYQKLRDNLDKVRVFFNPFWNIKKKKTILKL